MSVDTMVTAQPSSAAPPPSDATPPSAAPGEAARALNHTAHVAGSIYLAFAVLSALGYLYLPRQFAVPGDPIATIHRMSERAALFRLGMLSNLVGQFLFIYLVVELYELFKGVDRRLARQMVALVLVGVAATIVEIAIHAAPVVLLGRTDFLTAFTSEQLDALTLAFIRVGNGLSQIVVGFWGVWLIPFGLLTIRCGFLPRLLGYLLLLAALGYIVTCVTSTAFPAQLPVVSKLVFPLAFGELPIIFWLAFAGAKVRAPHAK